MAVSLAKGQKVSLTKDNPGLNKVMIGLGWDPVKKKGLLGGLIGSNFDCDASAILLKNGKYEGKDDIVYFNSLHHKSGSVQHMGDNLTGTGDGDDERIIVNLSDVPAEYDKIVFVVNIYEAYSRHQNFGMIENAFIRIIDARDNSELLRYDLSESYKDMTAMIFGEVYRQDGEWKFGAIGEGTKDGTIGELARRYIA